MRAQYTNPACSQVRVELPNGTALQVPYFELTANGIDLETLVIDDYDPDWRSDAPEEMASARLPGSAVLEGNLLFNLKEGSKISIDEGEWTTVEGTSVEIEVDFPGTYQIVVQAPLTMDQRFTMVVSE